MPLARFCTTAVTEAELRFGLALLPPGRRRAGLAAARRRAGRTADLQIAAIALARQLEAIATRNVAHFTDCGVPVINPWEAP